MPYGDANAIVMEMGNEVLPVARDTPVLAGVCGTDPFRLMPQFLRQVQEAGFAGVQNFPTVGLIDGTFRANLEETGMGYDLEVEMIREARVARPAHVARTSSTPTSARSDDRGGRRRARPAHGPDHEGHDRRAHRQDARRVRRARSRRCATPRSRSTPDVIVLCHGGPLAEPEDAQYVLDRTEGIVGFFGASSMERLPTEVAMTENMQRFKQLAYA